MQRAFQAAILLSTGLLGCGETVAPEVRFPAFVDTLPPEPFLVGDTSVSLTDARVAFGPAYFCASATGSATLCETAQGEVRTITEVDLLASEPVSLGTYRGFAGPVRSASFDYGIHWFLPEQEPVVSAEAPLGHSAHFAGTASRNGETLTFSADVDVIAQYQGQRAVPTASALGDVTDETVALRVRFSLPDLFADVDFAAMFDAGATNVAILPKSRDHDAIVIRMVSSSPPTFAWIGP